MTSVASLLNEPMSKRSRIAVIVATLFLIPSLFLPTWRITLHAPQYPDGLQVVIYPNTVQGDVDEVNILNHYIGMAQIEPDEFQEFRFIPFFIIRFVALAALSALAARMAIAALGWIDFTVFGLVMLYTLHFWLYGFGNNLASDAPLRLNPFTPNFIGSTQVGQFAVESWPASGALLMSFAGFIGPVVFLMEWRAARSRDK